MSSTPSSLLPYEAKKKRKMKLFVELEESREKVIALTKANKLLEAKLADRIRGQYLEVEHTPQGVAMAGARNPPVIRLELDDYAPTAPSSSTLVPTISAAPILIDSSPEPVCEYSLFLSYLDINYKAGNVSSAFFLFANP